MSKTIARNHHNKAVRAFAAATRLGAKRFDLDTNFRGVPVEAPSPGDTLEGLWRERSSAKLTEDSDGRYRLTLHSNHWYEWPNPAANVQAPAEPPPPSQEAIDAYAEKRQAKADRLRERADKAEAESTAAYRTARDIGSCIPLGQPVLVGHHSERRHRRALERIDNAMRRSVEADQKAARLRECAATIETNPDIRADDPEAIVHLKEKITRLQADREKMKACNRLVRSKKLDEDQKLARLTELLGSEASAKAVLAPDTFGQRGFAPYTLTNLGARIRAAEERLRGLVASRTLEGLDDEEGDGWTISYNGGENRVQIFLTGPRLPKERAQLFRRAGFVWSRTNGCYQRQLNSVGVRKAHEVVAAVFAKELEGLAVGSSS